MGKRNGQPTNTLCELSSHQDSRYALENGRYVLTDIACERIENAQRQMRMFA